MSARQLVVCNEPFWPETIEIMSLALEQVCADLGLTMRDDPATRMVAQKIIFLVQRGTKDVDTLRDLTLREFGGLG
jgi:hypothetical protein